MKTFKTLLLAIFFIGFACTAQAQFRIGPLVAFGGSTDIGIGAKAKFDLDDKFKISPSVIFLGSNDLRSITEFNGDAHYAFTNNEDALFYGIGGLNIEATSSDLDAVSGIDIGINLGVGAEFVIAEKFNAFAEAKFGVGGSSQFLVSGGIYLSL